MNNNRILSYHMSQELTKEEIHDVSGSGADGTSQATSNATWSQQGGSDISADLNYDF